MSDEWVDKMVKAAGVFTPGSPIHKKQSFYGRPREVRMVLSALRRKGQHAIIFGERGVGKTSLASVIHDMVEEDLPELMQVRVGCSTESSPSSIWHDVFRRVLVTIEENKVERLSQYLEKEPDPSDIPFLLEFAKYPTLIIIDEIDTIVDRRTIRHLADSIKGLSDQASNATLILVGVSDSVSTLIGEHQSIERSLVQVKVGRMPEEHLKLIVEKGMENIGLTIDPEVVTRLARLSSGLPYFSHLLGYHVAHRAIYAKSLHITLEHFAEAVDAAVDDSQESIKDAHHLATFSARQTFFPTVLLACALSPTDADGFFSAPDLRNSINGLSIERQYDIPDFQKQLNALCSERRGEILERKGSPKSYRYRFANPLVRPYTIMAEFLSRRQREFSESQIDFFANFLSSAEPSPSASP